MINDYLCYGGEEVGSASPGAEDRPVGIGFPLPFVFTETGLCVAEIQEEGGLKR